MQGSEATRPAMTDCLYMTFWEQYQVALPVRSGLFGRILG